MLVVSYFEIDVVGQAFLPFGFSFVRQECLTYQLT